jgi:hypothetical protein
MIKLKRIIEEIKLYEGLIYTHSLGNTIHMINYWMNNNSNKFYAYPKGSTNSHIGVDIERVNKKEYDTFLLLINNLGYFPSIYVVELVSGYKEQNKYNYNEIIDLINNDKSFQIILEAKYDIEISDDQITKLEKLYHASSLKNKEKILKMGLVPKSKEKKSKHPERIYLGYTLDNVMMLIRAPGFSNFEPEMVIYEIDMKSLNNNRKIRFFNDPNFSNLGCYTYENIPPQYIKLLKIVKT